MRMSGLGMIVVVAMLYVLSVPPIGTLVVLYGPANPNHPLRRAVAFCEGPFRWLQTRPPLDVPLDGYVRWCARTMDRIQGDRAYSRAARQWERSAGE
jgi:hypothetical protein